MPKLATPDNVTQLLQGMVRIDSVNSAVSGRAKAEAQLGDWLQGVAEAWGLPTQRLPLAGQADQILVTVEADPQAPWLLFDSHLDTVSVDGMTIDPFGGEIDGDRLYGRGSCDTKGTGAAMLWALKEYAADVAAGRASGDNVALYFGVDEEVTMTGVQAFIANDLPRLGWRPWAVIVGEPTEMHPVVAHNGAIRWTLTTKGRAAHSSTPHQGDSAITKMVEVVRIIEGDYIANLAAEDVLTGPAVCSITEIRGGVSHNIVPPSCTIGIDRRLVPGEDGDAVLPEIDRLLAPLGIEYEQAVDTRYPPLPAAVSERPAELCVRVLKAMKLPAMKVGAPFCTHAGHYAAAEIPAVVIGPGPTHTAHTKDEWVGVAEVERAVEMYGRMMRANL